MTETVNPGDTGPENWQKKLLPLMIRMLVSLTVFFFIASFLQIIYLHYTISHGPIFNTGEALSFLPQKVPGPEQRIIEMTRLKTLIMLEANAVDNHYHQAHILLMSRLWTSYIGFVTGMILALVGASFVLGKLREPRSELNAKTPAADFSFKSSSPGLVLAVLGTILMLATIVTHHNIDTTHNAIYFHDIPPDQTQGNSSVPSFPDIPPKDSARTDTAH